MDDFNFYNSENDGYRGGFGDYSDPIPTGGGPVQPGQAPRKKGGGKRIAALILACAIVGGGAGVGGAALYSHFSGSGSTTIYEAVEHPQVQTVVNSNSGKAMTPEQLYAANLGSCVGITVSTTTVNIFGQTTTSAASGSGFVLTQDGYIVTNYHVIEEAANDSSVSVEVAFANGDKYTAKLVGGEKDNDVAVLKIDATGLTPVTLGDSSKLVVGQSVYAIGNPLGELTYSFTDGIVSALDRDVEVDGTSMVLIQTSAAINMGNSGGALINQYGQVVGITTVKIVTDDGSAESLGFAIPSRRVKYVADTLIAGKQVRRGIFGFTVLTRTAQGGGLTLDSVDKTSDAYAKGLRAGDVLTAADGQSLNAVEDLVRLKQSMGAGDTVSLTYVRSGQSRTVSVTLIDPDEQT